MPKPPADKGYRDSYSFRRLLFKMHSGICLVRFHFKKFTDSIAWFTGYLIHPKPNLQQQLQRKSVDAVTMVLGQDELITERLRAVYPLHVLTIAASKWCSVTSGPELHNFRGTATLPSVCMHSLQPNDSHPTSGLDVPLAKDIYSLLCAKS